ncbi:MAG: ATP-binding protein [Proteobacteria bacterium]|nr:ATP-binding protein [Pseudomonadota bacterium]
MAEELKENLVYSILGIKQTKLGFFQEWQRNLRALKLAHQESERQRLANTAILEGITDVMMVLDKDMRILSVNRVMENLFPGRNCVGEYCYRLFANAAGPCPECPAFSSLLRQTVNRGSAIFQIGGGNRHFDMVASPLPEQPGSGKTVLMFKRDVTKEKALQAQIYQAEKMASIGMLAAGVAHEINNPLTAITGFAEGIRRRIPQLMKNAPPEFVADLEEYSSIILQESSRCRDIVQALVNFSRSQPSKKAVCLPAMIEETFSLLRHSIKQFKGIVIRLELDRDMPDVWLDDTQVRQVVLNLVTNALDALTISPNGEEIKDPQGSIVIRTMRETGSVILQVEDSGAGIEPRHLRMAFDPFFTTKAKGLGLGLTISYSVVKAHGGDIRLMRTPQGTTKVTVSLPLQDTDVVVPVSEAVGD